MPLLKSLPVAALALALCQCASGPTPSTVVKVSPTQGAVVAYSNQLGQNLSVANQSSLTAADAMAQRQADSGLKVIPDDELQRLANALESLSFFELATPEKDPGAKHWMVLQHANKRYYVCNNTTRDSNQAALFLRCIQAFTDTYNANNNFAGSKMTTGDLKRASQDINSTTKSIDPNRVRTRQAGDRKHP